jgi:hypothetical protein
MSHQIHKFDHRQDKRRSRASLAAKNPAKESEQVPTGVSKLKGQTKPPHVLNTKASAMRCLREIQTAKAKTGLGTEGWLGLMAFLGVLLGLYLAGVF